MAEILDGTAVAVETTLNAWIQTHLVEGAGLVVQYPRQPDFVPPDLFIQVHYLLGLREAFGQQAGSEVLSLRSFGLVNCNVVERVQTRTNLYAMPQALDALLAAFPAGQMIDGILVEGHTQTLVDDGATTGMAVQNCTVQISYLRVFALLG